MTTRNQRLDQEASILTQTNTPADPVGTLQIVPRDSPKRQDDMSFALADFTRSLQREYRSEAKGPDVWAKLILRPHEGGEAQGHYSIAYLDYGKVNPKGSIGRDQKLRGERLLEDLKTRVLDEMSKAGWVVVNASEGIYTMQDTYV